MAIDNRGNPIPDRVHGPGYMKHRVVIDMEDGGKVGVYSCRAGTPLEATGGCPDGCCDDYTCPDCGEEFRVEWPD